ncbi:MAG: hypothetical protein ABI315_00080 [Bacteroidia bacterium]
MKNKLFLLTLLGLLILLTGVVLTAIKPSLSSTASILMITGMLACKFFGLLMLVLDSNIRKTIYFKLMLLSMAIVLIGEVFFINQLVGSFLLLIAGAFSAIIVYSIRFYYKIEKKRLDILKLLWVLTTYIAMSLTVLNYLPKEAGYVSELIFWVMIFDYVISSKKTPALASTTS